MCGDGHLYNSGPIHKLLSVCVCARVCVLTNSVCVCVCVDKLHACVWLDKMHVCVCVDKLRVCVCVDKLRVCVCMHACERDMIISHIFASLYAMSSGLIITCV